MNSAVPMLSNTDRQQRADQVQKKSEISPADPSNKRRRTFGVALPTISPGHVTLVPTGEAPNGGRNINLKVCKEHQLTEEQRARMEQNRLRALSIRKKFQANRPPIPEDNSVRPVKHASDGSDWLTESGSESECTALAGPRMTRHVPRLICKSSVREKYCLPPDTVSMIPVAGTRPNGHNRKFSESILYDRKMVREVSYRRFGGRDGLVKERRAREEKKLKKLMGSVKGVFAG
mmetsp:Transcript_14852/g.29668  ORF Transcript_14852/g.29668 Transcript_14852/m.29668 type:complete len:233 (+) Transcript_14852:42-740(+)